METLVLIAFMLTAALVIVAARKQRKVAQQKIKQRPK